MKSGLLRRANRLNKNRKQKKWWQRTVRVMGTVVVFCTTYALILPALTMEQEAVCGVEAHEHTESCYTQQPVMEFSCGLEENVKIVHSHDTICYDAQGTLICTLSECQEHTHDESCYALSQTPTCGYEHVHDDTCVSAKSVLVCVKAETEGHVHSDSCATQRVQVCEIPESEGHTHGEGCGSSEQVLICTETDETVHTHAENCYETKQIPCEIPESVGHTHDESCYEEVCTLEEQEAHTHTEECYEEQTVTCELTTNDGHVHQEACYPRICGKEEVKLHTHDALCYDAADTLSCQQPQVLAHVHQETCLMATEQMQAVLICELEEHIHEESCYPEEESPYQFICGKGEHTHVETCFGTEGQTLCTILEHAHTASCIVEDLDLTADIETEDQWKTSFSEVVLTGNWSKDVLAVAETQLDYKESEKNLILADGVLKGYTRYGAWYGQPYADWNAMFVAFCLNYAGVEDYPVHSDCTEWVKALEVQQLFTVAGEYVPQPGDLVFFGTDLRAEPDGELSVDAIGIVSEIIPAEGEETAKFKTIQGDVDGKVDYVTWEQADSAILGYAVLPEPASACTQVEHTHTSECNDAGMNLICGMTEHTHDAQCGGLVEEKTEEQPVQNTVLTCTLPEHIHTLDCLNLESGAGLCTMEEHTHTEQCYTLDETLLYGELPLICTDAEHTHTSECYGPATAAFTYQDDRISLEVLVTSTKGLPEGMTMEITGLDDQEWESYESFASDSSQGELLGLTGYQIHFYADGREVTLPDAQVTANLTVLPVENAQPQTFSLRAMLMSFVDGEGSQEQENDVTVTVLQRGEDDISESGVDTSAETRMTLTLTGARTFALANRSAVNPEFTVQYYAHFPKMQYSTSTDGLAYYLDIIDTSGRKLPGNGKGFYNSPNDNPLMYLELERTGDTTDQMTAEYISANRSNGAESYVYKVRTELTLLEVYNADTYTYSSGMNIMHVDKLHENTHYELSEVWISEDGGTEWTVYTEDKDHWTEVEQGVWAHQEQNDEGHDYSVFEDNVTSVVGMGELHEVTFTNTKPENLVEGSSEIYIAPQSTVRMVYDLKTGTQNVSTNFFDYDISDTEAYLYDYRYNYDYDAYDSVDEAMSHMNDTYYGNRYYNGNIYMMTSAYGINSSSAYLNSGNSYFAFGNQNTGVSHRNDTLNGYYINGNNTNTFKYCSFGLVSGLENGILQYANGVAHQALFNDEVHLGASVPGKTTYGRQWLNFKRTGDTYILTSVNGGSANGDLGNGITENQLDTFIHPGYAWNTTTRQFANNFWPLDNTTGDDVGTHDMEFGQWNESNDRRYVGSNDASSFPNSDDGNAHNSYFGMEFAVDFQLDGHYCGPLEYLFYGDDDMWVFLTNVDTGSVQQICDIGGVHGSVGSFTNLWDYIPQGEEGAGYYRLNFFYTERGASGSSCYMEFTLPDATSVPQNIPETGSVSVAKDVPNADISVGESFQFLFQLSGTGSGINDTFAYEIENSDSTQASSGSIKSGQTFSLNEDQRITISGIPKGLTYTITEQLTESQTGGYNVSWTGKSSADGNSISGTVENGVTHSYTCHNKVLGSLEVTKMVEGTTVDTKFPIDVALTAPDGTPLSGTFGGTTFDANGKATVELASGEKVKFSGIPVGSGFTVQEQLPDGYVVRYQLNNETVVGTDGKVADSVSGTITYNTVAAIVVVNATSYNLPQTGGSGTFLFTFGGLLMMAVACMYFAIQIERKHRKGGVYRKS